MEIGSVILKGFSKKGNLIEAKISSKTIEEKEEIIKFDIFIDGVSENAELIYTIIEDTINTSVRRQIAIDRFNHAVEHYSI